MSKLKKNTIAVFRMPARALITLSILGACMTAAAAFTSPASAVALTNPLLYTFNTTEVLKEAATASQSTSPYFWLEEGSSLAISGGVGSTPKGTKQFMLLARAPIQSSSVEAYMNRLADNLSLASERHIYNGESVIARYQDINNYYYAGLRADGYAVIKKKTNGVFQTLATVRVFSGAYGSNNDFDLITLNKWIGLKLTVVDNSSGVPQLTFYTDIGRTGVWKQVLAVADSSKYGPAISAEGLMGIQSDYADMQFDNFKLADLGAPVAPAPAPLAATTYDSTILGGSPALYLTMASASSGTESDKSGHSMTGTYKGGAPATATLPNGDKAASFNGSNQYLTVPSNSGLSIPTTHKLTWEGWIRPDTFQFSTANSDGYVDWMGKCQDYSPSCEWEARIYGASTAEGRPNRLSAYVFNPSAGLGSAADWQPSSGVLSAGKWIHVVAEYDTTTTPSGCSSAYPGSINIWVNGVKQSFTDHAPTGCMSQFSVTPKAGSSALLIGTMTGDTWFKGAIGKVAVYDRLLSQSEISAHFKAMTGQNPSGSCGILCTTFSIL